MTPRRELLAFGVALAAMIAVPLGPALVGDRVLSPSDLALVQRSFGPGYGYEPANRLLTDPMLQFEPWIEFSREKLREGRLPLWNGKVGCGAPHLANGQSAVFDPFLIIAYLGPMPGALAWVAAARLWVAGLGMFLLASAWGLGGWGRWFAGICYSSCGFMTLWLLYPLSSVAAWLPWLMLASEWLVRRNNARSMAAVSACSALTLLGGHVQTAAHCFMLASAYILFRSVPIRRGPSGDRPGRAVVSWAAAMALGVATAAVAVVPLGVYLSRSPAWEDRTAEMGSPWELSRPRLLDASCTALPNLFGSQRRGHPNLAKALGVDNQNESAGGFSGLGTLIWLAPFGFMITRGRVSAFLAFAAVFGALASARVPPVDNLLRAFPVLDVTDHRRMSLWVAFGLVGLGAMGLDRLHRWSPSRGWRIWIGTWAVGAASFALGSAILPAFEPMIRDRATAHYDAAAEQSADLTPEDASILADRQVRNLLDHVPRTLLLASGNLAVLAALASWGQSSGRRPLRPAVFAVVVVDLITSLWGANPMIAPEEYRPVSPVIEHLARGAPPPARILAVGAELPPNMLMRYGLADVRNYDAIELGGMAEWLAPLFDGDGEGEARSSRRAISWAGVGRARDRLRACGVSAVVGASPPPGGFFDRVVRIGEVWVGHWDGPMSTALIAEDRDGIMVIVRPDRPDVSVNIDTRSPERITIPIPLLPGWTARCDRGPLPVSEGPGPLLSVEVPAGVTRVELKYDPPEVRLALGISFGGLASIGLLAIRNRSEKKGTKPLGPARSLALESIPKTPGQSGSARTRPPLPEGRDADGPLHV
jgi:hypothetical protein